MQDLSAAGAPVTAAYLVNGAVAALTAEVNVQAFTAPLYFQPLANSTTAWQLRNAAGTVDIDYDSTNGRLGLGTNAPGTRLHALIDDATTNAVTYVARLDHTTSGTAAAGIGTGLDFRTENAGGSTVDIGAVEVSLTNAGAGTEVAKVALKTLFSGSLGLAAEFETQPGFGSVWRFNNAAGGWRLRDQSDAEIWAMTTSGTWSLVNLAVMSFGGGIFRTGDGSFSSPSFSFASDTDTGFASGGTNSINTYCGATLIQKVAQAGTEFTQADLAGAGGTLVKATGTAHTALPANTENIDVDFALNRTVQFTAGTGIATQRAMVIRAPTYSATAAETITEAATLAITGQPEAGANVTLTESHALWVQNGQVFFQRNKTAGADFVESLFASAEVTTGADSGGFSAATFEAAQFNASTSSGTIMGADISGIWSSTGACTGDVVGIVARGVVRGAGIAAGTVTSLVGLATELGYDADALPTTGAITTGIGLIVQSPTSTAAGRTIGTMTGILVQNQGATGITTAIGIDVDAQSGATTNIGIRTASVIQITGGGIDHDAGNIGFFGTAPAAQASAYTQTFATADKTHANFTSNDLGAFTGGVVGFLDAAERDNVRTQFNALRADVDDVKRLVNSIIDDLQAYGLVA